MACFTSGVSRSWAPILKQNRNTVAGKGLITKNGHIMTRPHLWSPMCWWASLVAQRVKCLPAMQETWVRSLGQEDPLEKEMATHSSTLAWKIPWTEKPGRLQSMGSQRVGHNWVTSLHSLGWRLFFFFFNNLCFVIKDTTLGEANILTQPRSNSWLCV